MESAFFNGIQGLFLGVVNLNFGHVIMLMIASVLLYLGIKKGYEPLLLVPIGFGAILVNIPLSEMMGEEGFLRFFYDTGVKTEIFPLLIFLGIGAMTDFQPLLENPKIILLGAAGQFGIFITLFLALAVGFDKLEAVAVGRAGQEADIAAQVVTQAVDSAREHPVTRIVFVAERNRPFVVDRQRWSCGGCDELDLGRVDKRCQPRFDCQ